MDRKAKLAMAFFAMLLLTGMLFNPPSDYAPSEGDVLVVLGHRENLRQLERMAEGG